jgi:hypothetical protein
MWNLSKFSQHMTWQKFKQNTLHCIYIGTLGNWVPFYTRSATTRRLSLRPCIDPTKIATEDSWVLSLYWGRLSLHHVVPHPWRAPMLPHGSMPMVSPDPPPCWGGFWCHHVAPCPWRIPELTSLLRWAPMPPRGSVHVWWAPEVTHGFMPQATPGPHPLVGVDLA